MATNCTHCDCPLMNLLGEKRAVCVRCRAAQFTRARIKRRAKNGPKARKTERICKDCRQLFPCADGRVMRQCEPCRKIKRNKKRKRYYEANKERISLRDRTRYHADPSIARKRAKQYYETHREQVLAKKRERAKSDPVSSTKLGMMR